MKIKTEKRHRKIDPAKPVFKKKAEPLAICLRVI
jgi:hypothetical protein